MSVSSDKSPQAPVCVYYCGHEQCRSGHRFGPASRNHHLLHFVARGSGTLKNTYGEFEISAGNGDMAIEGDVWSICYGDKDRRGSVSFFGKLFR